MGQKYTTTIKTFLKFYEQSKVWDGKQTLENKQSLRFIDLLSMN